MPARLLLLPSVLLLAACGEKNSFAPPPPVPVGVQSAVVRDQQTFSEFPGRIQAMQVVEVRARVQGILETIEPGFRPGKRIEAGTPLFKIESAPYVAVRDTAQAALDKANANLSIAVTTLNARENAGQGVSQIQVESAKIDVQAANANVAAAKADLDAAQLNVDYCEISAPISGRISELEVDQFNLVGSGESTLLCTIVHDESMHIYFEANEREALGFLDRRKNYEDSKRTPPMATLTLANGSSYLNENGDDEKAQIELADNRIDSDTGTLRVRAVVPNPDGKLADGLFVRVKVPHPDVNRSAILVPNIAIQQDIGGYFVLTVGEGNKVVRKNLVPGDRVKHLRIIRSGLTGDEKIITVGLQRVREGIVVAPSEAPPVEDAPPSAATPTPSPAPSAE